MNITITQDNSRTEHLGSTGEFVINKLYELAIDNPDINLSGFIFSTNAIGSKMDYLNQRFEGNLIIQSTNRYFEFKDDMMRKVLCRRLNLSEDTQFTEQQMNNTSLIWNKAIDLTSDSITDEERSLIFDFRDLKGLEVMIIIRNGSAYTNLTNMWLNPKAFVSGAFLYENLNIQNKIYYFAVSNPYGLFRNTDSVTDLYFARFNRNNQSNLAAYSLFGKNFDLIYVRNVDIIDVHFSYSNINKLVIDKVTPPEITNTTDTDIVFGNAIVYVPDDSVQSYITALNGLVYPEKIKGISELEQVDLDNYNVSDIYDIPIEIQEQIHGKLIKQYRTGLT